MQNNQEDKKNVIFLANCGVNSTMLSGGEIRFIEIAKRWKKYVNISTMMPSVSRPSFNNQGLIGKYIILPFSFFDKAGILFSYFIRTILACVLIFRYKKQVIYSTSDFIPDIFPAFMAKIFFPNTLWVVSVHHLIPHFSKRSGNKIVNIISFYAQKCSLFFIKNFADKVVVISREFLTKYKFRNCFKSQNGIDFDFISNIHQNKKFHFDCMFLGRLSYSKGIFDLVEIWKKIVKHKPDITLGMIGGGNEQIIKKLSKKIKENNLEKNITLLGYLSRNEIFSILKSGKIFVFPSHEEGWGISIAEAMACSLPVICYNLEAYKDIFNDNNVIKIAKFDTDKFYRIILKLLNNPKTIGKLSHISLEQSKKFSWDKIAKSDYNYIFGA